MTTNDSTKSASLARNLLVIVLIVSILLTALAIYDMVNGEDGLSVWVAIICWPIVAIANGFKLYKLRQNR